MAGITYNYISIDLPKDLADALRAYQQGILTYHTLLSVEDEPHITVKYGLLPGTEDDILKTLAAWNTPIGFSVGASSHFDTDSGPDVVKFEVLSDDLAQLHALLSVLPNVDSHPHYVPHITAFYCEKGEGQLFHNNNITTREKYFVDVIKYTDTCGKIKEIRIMANSDTNFSLGEVGFAVTEGIDLGDTVLYPNSKIFECGIYPDKEFELNEDEKRLFLHF